LGLLKGRKADGSVNSDGGSDWFKILLMFIRQYGKY